MPALLMSTSMPPASDDRVDGGGDRLVARHVELNEPAAQLVGGRAAAGLVACAHPHGVAGLDESAGCFVAEALVGPGDQCCCHAQKSAPAVRRCRGPCQRTDAQYHPARADRWHTEVNAGCARRSRVPPSCVARPALAPRRRLPRRRLPPRSGPAPRRARLARRAQRRLHRAPRAGPRAQAVGAGRLVARPSPSAHRRGARPPLRSGGPASSLRRTEVPAHIPPGVQRLVARLGEIPVAVFTASWDLLELEPALGRAARRTGAPRVGPPESASRALRQPVARRRRRQNREPFRQRGCLRRVSRRRPASGGGPVPRRPRGARPHRRTALDERGVPSAVGERHRGRARSPRARS